MVPYIIGGAVAIILIAVIGYYAARFMKGKLKLELARATASSGEALTGRVSLQAKRAIRGQLTVSLVGRQQKRKRRAGGGNDTTEWVEVYRRDQTLQEARDFAAGFTQTYTFELAAPTSAEARQGGGALRAAAKQAGGGAVSSMMQIAAGAADMMQGRVHWHVESRLDADGVDLFTKRTVRVNLRD